MEQLITTHKSISFSFLKFLKQVKNYRGPDVVYPLAITNAVYGCLRRFNNKYTLIDENITYYIAPILDPQIKALGFLKLL